MLVYRITLKAFSAGLYAPGFVGQWNGAGRKVIYCSESIPLAFLENMIRRQGVGFNQGFKIMVLEIPDNLKIEIVNVIDLKTGWRSTKDYSKCQPIGNAWYDSGTTPVLKVPSAILPEAFNFVINSVHTDFKSIKILEVTDLVPDERIEELLKKHPKV